MSNKTKQKKKGLVSDSHRKKEPQVLKDRIGKYLRERTGNYVFDEFSDGYLERANLTHILKGVPIPISKKDMENLNTLKVAKNMAYVIGCDINFKYREEYLSFIKSAFGDDFVKALIATAVELAEKKEFIDACVILRGALLLDPDNQDAIYCYARACHDIYQIADNEDFVGRFKAESMEAFEKVTIKAPEFDMGYYFLGYAYMNLGLYLKAKLTFAEFTKKTSDEKLKAEVTEWMKKLEEPVKIEEGYNRIISGRYDEGIGILKPYCEDDRFNSWWPLWYYIGIAENARGNFAQAVDSLKQALSLSPSNTDCMEEVIKAYEKLGDETNIKKYRKKIDIVNKNREEERVDKNPGIS